MSEMVIKINETGVISVEETIEGVKSIKLIEPDGLIKCISRSLTHGISTGLLPGGCLSFIQNENGDIGISLLFPDNKADISYYETLYPDFPLPKMVFSFQVNSDGRVFNCGLGVTAADKVLKPDTKMFRYPFSNVSGFRLCIGNNILPKCKSLHTLASLPYLILSMPNNNDHFAQRYNKPGLEMRNLLELLKDKEPEYYYGNILVPFEGVVLNDFINLKNAV